MVYELLKKYMGSVYYQRIIAIHKMKLGKFGLNADNNYCQKKFKICLPLFQIE